MELSTKAGIDIALAVTKDAIVTSIINTAFKDDFHKIRVTLLEYIQPTEYIQYMGYRIDSSPASYLQAPSDSVPQEYKEQMFEIFELREDFTEWARIWNNRCLNHKDFCEGMPGKDHNFIEEESKLIFEEMSQSSIFQEVEGRIIAITLLGE